MDYPFARLEKFPTLANRSQFNPESLHLIVLVFKWATVWDGIAQHPRYYNSAFTKINHKNSSLPLNFHFSMIHMLCIGEVPIMTSCCTYFQGIFFLYKYTAVNNSIILVPNYKQFYQAAMSYKQWLILLGNKVGQPTELLQQNKMSLII